MPATMDKIRLVLLVPETTRRALRIGAVTQDMDMSELAQVILDHTLAQLQVGKTPKDLMRAIEEFKQRPREDADD